MKFNNLVLHSTFPLTITAVKIIQIFQTLQYMWSISSIPGLCICSTIEYPFSHQTARYTRFAYSKGSLSKAPSGERMLNKVKIRSLTLKRLTTIVQ